MRVRSRLVLIVLGWVAWAAPVAALDGPARAEILRQMKGFADKKEQAQKVALGEFDKELKRVSTSGGPAVARADKVKALNDAKTQLKNTGRFPDGPEYARTEFDYYMALDKASRPVAKLLDGELDRAVRASNQADEDEVRKFKDAIDKELGGDQVRAGTVWPGTVNFDAQTLRYRVEVHSRAGNTIKGLIVENGPARNHPEYEFEGTVDGLGFSVKSTRIRQGHVLKIELNGVVAGDRIVARLTQVTKKGRTEGAFVVVGLKK